jgi:hypothetical protein
MGMRSVQMSRRAWVTVGVLAAAAAAATAIVTILSQRELITTAAIVMDPETGQMLSSRVSAGYSYPSFGAVATLAVLAAGLVVTLAVAWMRRAELVSAAKRRGRGEPQDDDILMGDTLGMLDHAVAEQLD